MATYLIGRGERSRAAANPLIRDLGPTSPQGPRVREHGRRQATAALGALGALRMTRRLTSKMPVVLGNNGARALEATHPCQGW